MIGRAGEDATACSARWKLGRPYGRGERVRARHQRPYHRAESEGGQIVTPLEDMLWGESRPSTWRGTEFGAFAERLSEEVRV